VRSLTALLALILAALTLAACGAAGTDSSNDFEGDEREVASVVEDLQSAAADDDASKICRSLLATSLLEQMGGDAACQRTVAKAIDAADTDELEVQSVQVSGTNATARVKSGKGDSASTHTVRLAREGSNWKIATL
jgi:hypothetical protein